MHGIYPENVGVIARLFKDEDDFDYLDHSTIFTAERDGQNLLFLSDSGQGAIWPHLKSKHMLLMGMRFYLSLKRRDFEIIAVISTKT